jgi:PAS domain S-box-containing protein
MNIPCLKEYFAYSDRFFYFLAEGNGRLVFINSRLLSFALPDKKIPDQLTSIFQDPPALERILDQCRQQSGILSAELAIRSAGGIVHAVAWEFSVCLTASGEEQLQATGVLLTSTVSMVGGMAGKMADAWKAYEQTTEGLWRFDSDEPVSVNEDPARIIAYWRNHSKLAECNDNMARMYGYEKAEELQGARLDEFIDFSDHQRMAGLQQFIQNRFKTTTVETREFDRNGRIKYFRNSMEGLVEQGLVTSVWGTQQDITEQREAEEKNRYLALLMENVSDIIISLDCNFQIVSWNKTAAELYGYTETEAIGKKMAELLHINYPDGSGEKIYKEIIEKGNWKGELSIVNRFGKQLTVFVTGSLLRDASGNITGYISTGKDITGKRVVEEKLQHSEEFYRNLIGEAQDGIVLTDDQGIIRFSAPTVTKVLGYDPAEVIGTSVFSYTHPADLGAAQQAFQNEMVYANQPTFIHLRLLKKNGDWVWCVVRAVNMMDNPAVGMLVIYFYDNSAGRTMLEALQRQSVALSSVFDLIITCDLNYIIESWNKRAEQVVGFTEEEVKGKFLGDVTRLDYGPFTSDEVAAILAEKGNWQGEISFVNRYGVKKTVLHTASYLMDETGKKTSIIGTGIDITEKKATEEQLKESELFYRNLFVNSLDGVLITNQDAEVQFASPSITTIFGYSPELVIGKKPIEFTHPDDQQLAMDAFGDVMDGNRRRTYISIRLRHQQGHWVWCIVRGHNLFSNPYIKGMVVYLYDDTLRKKTEQALINSERRFRAQATLLDNVTDVIVTVNMNREVSSWNGVVEKLTGISANEAVGKPYRSVITTNYHPFTNEQVFAIVKDEGIWRGEISFPGFDGKTRYLLHTISLLKNEKGEPTGMMGVGKDITERKQIEEQLLQSEQFFRSLAANSLDGIMLTDITGKVTYCGPSVFHLSGYETSILLGKNILDFVHPDDRPNAIIAFEKEAKRESTINFLVARLYHAERGWVWCTIRGHNLLHDPVLKSMVIYFTDDTKRKMIEDRLKESERRFRSLIHDLKLGVILQNEESEMLVCNQAALDLLGLTEDQLLGKTSFDPAWNVIHEDGSPFPGDTHPVPMSIKTRKPVRDVVMGVYRPRTEDRVWLLVNAEPVFDGDQQLINVVCSFTDISEQKRMAQQLTEQEIQKQKLITQATIDGQEKERQEIGKELHDNINQHLTTTRLYLEVARDKAIGEAKEMIDLAEKNLAEIVQEIRQMSQSLVPPTLGDIGLVESVQDLCYALKRTHSFQIDFQHPHFDESGIPESMKLMIFRIIQEQINNIIRHARAQKIVISLLSDAEQIQVSLRDNGQGFDPQQYKKGMGLNNIVNRAALFNGRVQIISAPGQGCTVTVSVPAPVEEG